MIWNRFAVYKRGQFDVERSKQFMVCIYEMLEKQGGKNGWLMIGDGQNVVGENVNVQLIYSMLEVTEKYYPNGLKNSIPLDLPQFFIDIVKEILPHMSPDLLKTVVFMNSTELREKVLNEDNIPAYKRALIGLKP